MAADADIKNPAVAAAADECSPPLLHPLCVNISPILKSVAGKLADAEIDQWLAGLYDANEGRGAAATTETAAGLCLGAEPG